MPFIVWDDSLDLHIDAMNEEHKVLIDLMNRLHEQFQSQNAKLTLKATLLEFASYTEKHFQDEEAYMQSIDFQDLDVHRSIHQRLLSRVKTYVEEFLQTDGTLSPEFFEFLKIWVVAHIKGIDAKYAAA